MSMIKKGQRLQINNDYSYIIFVSSLKDLFIKDNLYKDKSTELWLVIYL